MAQKEDYASAAAHLKKYLEVVPNSGDQDTVKKQLAEIEKFAGTTPQQQQQQQ
jgi:regulator of sirC expression with transglutaminase-like and TPR domain